MEDSADVEQDRALWREFASTRDQELRSELIQRYIGLAKLTAARLYQRRIDNSVTFADYLQYARVGLVEAIDHYDPARCHSRRFPAIASRARC
jgi:RNA polymerase sigma factor for flagellar operon FliA